jgi:hypothetical protein
MFVPSDSQDVNGFSAEALVRIAVANNETEMTPMNEMLYDVGS